MRPARVTSQGAAQPETTRGPIRHQRPTRLSIPEDAPQTQRHRHCAAGRCVLRRPPLCPQPSLSLAHCRTTYRLLARIHEPPLSSSSRCSYCLGVGQREPPSVNLQHAAVSDAHPACARVLCSREDPASDAATRHAPDGPTAHTPLLQNLPALSARKRISRNEF